ncbi:hypothetical protein ACFLTD_04060, partial [Elusimicrobiota bacterium]
KSVGLGQKVAAKTDMIIEDGIATIDINIKRNSKFSFEVLDHELIECQLAFNLKYLYGVSGELIQPLQEVGFTDWYNYKCQLDNFEKFNYANEFMGKLKELFEYNNEKVNG